MLHLWQLSPHTLLSSHWSLTCPVMFMHLSAVTGHLLCVGLRAGCGEHGSGPDAPLFCTSLRPRTHWDAGHPTLPVPYLSWSPSLATCPRACLPGVCPTPVHLAEDHSPVHLDILFFWGQSHHRTGRNSAQTTFQALTPKARAERGSWETQPHEELTHGYTLLLRTTLAAGCYVGEEMESL